MSISDNAILVTGGAGYIGSHVVKALMKAKASTVVVLDNLSTGFIESLPSTIKFIQGDILDFSFLCNLLAKEKIKIVIHLAAKTVIPESISNPQWYYQTNVVGTLNLARACLENNVDKFIYSSTAAVYAKSEKPKITEMCKTTPSNPYGHSKLMAEKMLEDIAQSHPFKYVILRYFNVAGADPEGDIGQRTLDATHLIKVAVQTACNLTSYLTVFGTDYPTPDGTCIRDFIHVSDLASAHLSALQYLNAGGKSCVLNCGYGRGYSVKEVISALERITRSSLPILLAPPRPGDLPKVVADNTQIKTLFNWQPQFDNIDFIIQTALTWEKELLKKGALQERDSNEAPTAL